MIKRILPMGLDIKLKAVILGRLSLIGALQEDSIWSFNVGNIYMNMLKLHQRFPIILILIKLKNILIISMIEYSLSKKFKINLDYDYVKIHEKLKRKIICDEQGYPNSKGEYYDSNFCVLV